MYRYKIIQIRHWLISILAFHLFLLTPAMAAGIYKCTKINGDVEYSQSPISECASKVMRDPVSQADPEAVKKLKENLQKDRLAAEQKKADKQQQKDKEEQQKEKDKYCSSQKSNLDRLTSNPKIFKTEKGGNRVILTEEQRQQRIRETQNSIATYCK